jgi:hypothetical protein
VIGTSTIPRRNALALEAVADIAAEPPKQRYARVKSQLEFLDAWWLGSRSANEPASGSTAIG